MPSLEEIKALKKKISSDVLQVEGVAGLGVPDGQLTVYLEKDAPTVRANVQRLLDRLAPGARARFMVTGGFRAF